MKTRTILAITFACLLSIAAHAQNSPTSDGVAAAPDAWLLVKRGQPWWYRTQPSPTPVELQQRMPTSDEQMIIDRARDLLARRSAKAFALMDGDHVLMTDYKAPADSDAVLFGFSMGKTVTSMAVGQAICAGKLTLETKASELVPELNGKAFGNATVRDLLRMASGAAEPNADTTVWTPEQFKEWGRGNLNLLDLIISDRVAHAERGLFSEYKPGEHFVYKNSDPLLLGIVVSRAVGMPWNQWLQQQVLNPMGAARTGLYVQDRQENGLADSGLRMRLEDWMRFALWVKRSSQAAGCFGDYVRNAMSKQISNGYSSTTRKVGKLFAGYGYLIWTDNEMVPHSAWAVGWGGQRIGWDKESDRMVVVFSNVEDWMPELYDLTKDWNRLSK
jgi:CubicO group peptidase (beta-lactamase class C family)